MKDNKEENAPRIVETKNITIKHQYLTQYRPSRADMADFAVCKVVIGSK